MLTRKFKLKNEISFNQNIIVHRKSINSCSSTINSTTSSSAHNSFLHPEATSKTFVIPDNGIFKRELPDTCTDFGSEEGKILFGEALAKRMFVNKLIRQYSISYLKI